MLNYALVFNVIYTSIFVFNHDLNQMAVSPILISYLINIVLFNLSPLSSVEHFILALTSQEIKNCGNLGAEKYRPGGGNSKNPMT